MTHKRKKSILRKSTIKKKLDQFLEETVRSEFTLDELAFALKLHHKKEKRKLKQILGEGIKEEGSTQNKPQKANSNTNSGKFHSTSQGFGFVSIEGFSDDVFIPKRHVGGAFHGDEVAVRLHAPSRNNGRPEGKVVKVLQRRKTKFVCRLEVDEHFAFAIPDNKKMGVDFYIKKEHLNGGKTNQKVVVSLLDWPKTAKNPEGKVMEILGDAGTHKAEMDAIIHEFDLPLEFPKAVSAAAEEISDRITQEEIDQRRDFRHTTTFTIDPEDAKDFDDAISIQFLEDKVWEVGVHIADVSHYLQPDTALDKEAAERATSVYLVDRVIPMLPEKLSNNLCSLRPNEEKLTFAVVFKMTESGEVLSEWFGKTVICSDKRFSYEEAQEVLDGKKASPFKNDLRILNKMAHHLRRKKFKNGAISFESPEVKFKLDENGKPIDVIPKNRKDVHKLIEDFMLLANKAVAQKIWKKDPKFERWPFPYRYHDVPKEDKLESFAAVARSLGYTFRTDPIEKVPFMLNDLLKLVEGMPEQNLIESLAIKSMAKAKYTTHHSSHFGLGFDAYTHFTSPIRRYPDVLVHRLLHQYLSGNFKQNIQPLYEQDVLEKHLTHDSEKEVAAEEAERASVKYKQIEYLMERTGEVFEGVISGVKNWGIYVELTHSKCEGMVKVESLLDDFYVYDDENYRMIGHNNGKIFQLGDKVRVRVLQADLKDRVIEFDFA